MQRRNEVELGPGRANTVICTCEDFIIIHFCTLAKINSEKEKHFLPYTCSGPFLNECYIPEVTVSPDRTDSLARVSFPKPSQTGCKNHEVFRHRSTSS